MNADRIKDVNFKDDNGQTRLTSINIDGIDYRVVRDFGMRREKVILGLGKGRVSQPLPSKTAMYELDDGKIGNMVLYAMPNFQQEEKEL